MLCLSALISYKLVIRSRSFIRFGGEAEEDCFKEGSVLFHLEGPNTSCFPFSVKLAALDDHCPAVSIHYGCKTGILSSHLFFIYFILVVQWLSCVQLFEIAWTAAHRVSLSLTNSRSLPKLIMSIESVLLPNHLILHRPLILLPSIFLSIRVFSSESALHIRWPKNWSFSISPSNEYSGLISFRIDWFDLLAVQGILKSLLQHHSLKASILRYSAFIMVQLSHPYMTTGKTIALTIQTFVSKVMSLLFNMLSRLVIAFLPRSKCHGCSHCLQ